MPGFQPTLSVLSYSMRSTQHSRHAVAHLLIAAPGLNSAACCADGAADKLVLTMPTIASLGWDVDCPRPGFHVCLMPALLAAIKDLCTCLTTSLSVCVDKQK